MVFSWSARKDSAFGLWTLLGDPAFEVRALLTTITEGYSRVIMSGVREELLDRQGDTLGLPVIKAWIPPACANEVYEPSIVRADPVFLDRVLTNLLDNAAKAARESGTEQVEVESERPDARAVIRVIDHGPGVPESVREQLFYPFYQVSERHPRLGDRARLSHRQGVPRPHER